MLRFTAGFFLLAGMAVAQPPSLRVTTALVEVHVLVHDKKGRPVSGLTRDDFIVKDRGAPQTITFFSEETSRPAAPPPELVPPNVFSNFLRRGNLPGGATVVLFDKLNTRTKDQNWARGELIKFFRMASATRQPIAILVLEYDLHILADFGWSAQRLQSAIAADRTRRSQLLSASEIDPLDPPDEGFEVEGGLDLLSRRVAEVAVQIRVGRTLRALEAIGRHLSGLPGRKSILWISGAFPVSMGYEPDHLMDWRSTRLNFSPQSARAGKVLTDANVALYPVDARGLFGVPMANAASGTGLGADGARMPGSILQAHQTMRALADDTGGKAYYDVNDLSGTLRQALDDASVVYVLGYQPTHNEWNGEFRPIEVKVKREGLRVRCRRGYFASAELPAGQVPAPLREAFWSPLEATGIGLTASIDATNVLLRVDARHLTLKPEGEFWTGMLDVLFVQQNPAGKDLDMVRTAFDLRLTRATLEESLESGVRLTREIRLLPAASRLRIAVRDRPSGRIGSLTISLNQTRQP